jgi:hypothetical protein
VKPILADTPAFRFGATLPEKDELPISTEAIGNGGNKIDV